MNWFMYVLFLFGIKSIYSKKYILSDPSEINDFLDKILESDKFDELADRIAIRAVEKINDFQNFKTSPTGEKSSITDEIVFRSRDDTSSTLEKQNKHKHGKIDVEAVLKKVDPLLDNLKLKFNNLKKQQVRATPRLKEEESENMDSNDNNEKDTDNEMSYNPVNHESKPENYKKNADDVQLDFHNNIKTLSDEKFDNPFGDGKTVSWNEETSTYPIEGTQKFRSDTNAEPVRENYNNVKKTPRIEGDKQFISEDHQDYKQYNEELDKVENI